MKKFSKILVGLLVVVCIVEGFFLYRAYAIPSTTLQTARKINRIEQIIDKYYKGSVKKSEIGRIVPTKGLVAGLGDVYSTYYSEDDFNGIRTTYKWCLLGVNIPYTGIKTGANSCETSERKPGRRKWTEKRGYFNKSRKL